MTSQKKTIHSRKGGTTAAAAAVLDMLATKETVLLTTDCSARSS